MKIEDIPALTAEVERLLPEVIEEEWMEALQREKALQAQVLRLREVVERAVRRAGEGIPLDEFDLLTARNVLADTAAAED